MSNLSQNTFWERRLLYGEAIVEFLEPLGPFFLLSEMYGNAGDQLIQEGTRTLFDDNAMAYETLPRWRVSEVTPTDSILVVPGSGAYHRLWHEWLPDLVLDAASKFSKVILLPSMYDGSVGIVREVLELDNVFAFARDPDSYEVAAEFGRSTLAYDLALLHPSFSELDVIDPAPDDGTGVLLALRLDAGSSLTGTEWRPHALNNDVAQSASSLSVYFDLVRASNLVITDRLHVAVSAALSGRQVRYIDPYDSKISSYLDFILRGEFDDYVEEVSLEWLVDGGYVEGPTS